MTTRKLPRRTFLRGAGLAGITIALPTLDAMLDDRGLLHGTARADGSATPKRLVLFHFPNGSDMRDWTPSSGGAALAAPPVLATLADHTADINVISGLSTLGPFDAKIGNIDDHQRAATTFLTGVPTTANGAGGISMDQLAGQHLGAANKFSSLVVYASSENSVFHSRMSWSAADAPVEPTEDPNLLFDQLFSDLTLDPDAAAKATLQRKSVLDYVKGDIADLEHVLGAGDRARLEQHLEAIREIEKALGASASASCTIPAAPGTGADYEERVDLLLDLCVMALRCDLTRVLSFSLGSTNNTNVYSFLGLTDPDHEISHYLHDPGNPATRPLYEKMTTWKISKFSRLLNALKTASDGAAPLLDSAAVICASEMSNGDWHSTKSLPVLVAGKLGAMPTGKHLLFPCDAATAPHAGVNDGGWCSAGAGVHTSLSRLWLAALQAIGAPVTSFGDATSPLDGLWV